MASGGGPRAAGSGIANEGKFRQRVEDHYRTMASAKKGIKRAGQMQLASALGLGTVTGAAGTLLEDSSAMALCAVGVVLMIATGLAARAAPLAAGAKDAEKHAIAYASSVRMLSMLLLLTASAVATAVYVGAALPPTPVAVAAAVIGGIDLLSCALGQITTAKLLGAFEEQKRKAAKKL
jgi:hypothetical protein